MKEINKDDENITKDFKGKHTLFMGVVAIGLCLMMINVSTSVKGWEEETWDFLTTGAVGVMVSWAFGWYDDNEPTNDEATGELWESYASNMCNSTQAILDSKATEIYNLATLLNATSEYWARFGEARVIEYNLINDTIWGSWGTDENMIVTEPFYANMGDMAGSFSQSTTNYLKTMNVLDDQLESDSETKCDIEMIDTGYNIEDDWEGWIAGIHATHNEMFYGKVFNILSDSDTALTINVSQFTINTETGTYDETYLSFSKTDNTDTTGQYHEITLPEWGYYKINSPSATDGYGGGQSEIIYLLTQGVLYDNPNDFQFRVIGKSDADEPEIFNIDGFKFHDTYNSQYYTLYITGTGSIGAELDRWSDRVEEKDSYIRNTAQTYKNILQSFGWYDVDDVDETYIIPLPHWILPDYLPGMNYTEMLIIYYAWLERLNETLNKGWDFDTYDISFSNIKTHVWVTVEHSTKGIIINNTESIFMPHSHAIPIFVNTSFQPSQQLYIYALEDKVVKLYNIIGTAETTRASEYTITVHRITEDGIDVDESIILFYTMDEYYDTEYPNWDVPDIQPSGGFDWLTNNIVTIACGILTGVAVIIYFWKGDNSYLIGALLLGILTIVAYFVIDPILAGTFSWTGWFGFWINTMGVR